MEHRTSIRGKILIPSGGGISCIKEVLNVCVCARAHTDSHDNTFASVGEIRQEYEYETVYCGWLSRGSLIREWYAQRARGMA